MPFSVAMAAFMAALVLIPVGWLAVTSLREDASRIFTLALDARTSKGMR